jgi:hypothetical protein
MNDRQTAWVAALIEGEGFIGITRSNNAIDGRRAQISVKMTDEDVMHTLAAVTGLGRVTGPYKTSGKDVWRWQVSAKHDLQILLARIKPLMHARRRRAITDIQERFLGLTGT